MKPHLKTVYLPVKVEDDATFLITKEVNDYLQCNSSIDFYNGKRIYTPAFITETTKESGELEHLITHRLDKQEGYFFTPEQLNQLLSDVIKDALNAAAEKATLSYRLRHDDEFKFAATKESITNTFEETFNKYKV